MIVSAILCGTGPGHRNQLSMQTIHLSFIPQLGTLMFIANSAVQFVILVFPISWYHLVLQAWPQALL